MKLTTENTENTEGATPETDDQPCIMALNDNGYQVPCVDIKFARRLERERDEARNIGEKLSKQGLDMMDENRSLKRERDEARELLSAAQNALDAIHLEVGAWIEKLKESK